MYLFSPKSQSHCFQWLYNLYRKLQLLSLDPQVYWGKNFPYWKTSLNLLHVVGYVVSTPVNHWWNDYMITETWENINIHISSGSVGGETLWLAVYNVKIFLNSKFCFCKFYLNVLIRFSVCEMFAWVFKATCINSWEIIPNLEQYFMPKCSVSEALCRTKSISHQN